MMDMATNSPDDYFSRTLHDFRYFKSGKYRADGTFAPGEFSRAYQRATGGKVYTDPPVLFGTGKFNLAATLKRDNPQLYNHMVLVGKALWQQARLLGATSTGGKPKSDWNWFSYASEAYLNGTLTIHTNKSPALDHPVVVRPSAVGIFINPRDVAEYKGFRDDYLDPNKALVSDKKHLDKILLGRVQKVEKLATQVDQYMRNKPSQVDRIHYLYNNNTAKQLMYELDKIQRFVFDPSSKISSEARPRLQEFVRDYQTHIAKITNIGLDDGQKQTVIDLQNRVSDLRKQINDPNVPKALKKQLRAELKQAEHMRDGILFMNSDYRPGSTYSITPTAEGQRLGVTPYALDSNNHPTTDVVGSWYGYKPPATPTQIATTPATSNTTGPHIGGVSPPSPSQVAQGYTAAQTQRTGNNNLQPPAQTQGGTAGQSLAQMMYQRANGGGGAVPNIPRNPVTVPIYGSPTRPQTQPSQGALQSGYQAMQNLRHGGAPPITPTPHPTNLTPQQQLIWGHLAVQGMRGSRGVPQALQAIVNPQALANSKYTSRWGPGGVISGITEAQRDYLQQLTQAASPMDNLVNGYAPGPGGWTMPYTNTNTGTNVAPNLGDMMNSIFDTGARTGDDINAHLFDRDHFRNEQGLASGVLAHFNHMRDLASRKEGVTGEALAPLEWLKRNPASIMAGYDPSVIASNMDTYHKFMGTSIAKRRMDTTRKQLYAKGRTASQQAATAMMQQQAEQGMQALFGGQVLSPKRTLMDRFKTWYHDYFNPRLDDEANPHLLSQNAVDYLHEKKTAIKDGFIKSVTMIGKALPLVAKPLNVLAKALGKMAAAAGHAGSAFFGGASALLGNPLDASTLDAVAGMGGAIGGMSGAGISAFGGMISGAGGALGKFSEGGSGEAVSGAPGGGKLGKLAGAAGAVGAGMQIAGGFISAAGGAVTSGWNTAVNLLKSINKATLKIMSASPLFETIKNILNLAFQMVFLPAMTLLEGTLMPTFTNLLDWAVDFGGKFADEFEQYIGPITKLFENTISNFTGWMSDHMGDIAEMVSGMVSLLPSMMDMTFGLLEIFVEDKDLIINLCKYTIQTMEKVMSENLIGSLLKMARYGVDFIDVYGEPLGRFMADATSLLIKITEYLSPILWIIKGLYALVDTLNKASSWLSAFHLFAEGGYVPPRVGGTEMLINGVPSITAEAGEGEYVIPESKMPSGGITVVFSGEVYGMSDFEQKVKGVMNKYNTRASYR